MCGIAGIFHLDRGRAVAGSVLTAMTRALAHRGPDGEGVQLGPGFGLGHRRLAIIDLAGGAQPMATADGRYVVVFNGEIYNHLDLRRRLEAAGHVFRTRSDTEVLLLGYREWGSRLVDELRGMFAFAIVDTEQHELFAARDRLGKKPLYWLLADGTFAFGSELKALHALGFERTLDPAAVAQFFALRYVPDPRTVFAGVHKLAPGHWCKVSTLGMRCERYWRLSFAAVDQGAATGTQQQRVLELLDEATRLRLMAEVPLAPFLSGGIDSYAVVDAMTRAVGRGVTACTIGFDDPACDERPAARAAAAACGAVLHEEELRGSDLLQLDWLADTFDEPFADSSAVPTYHVSRLARRHVTVALSGDGGDESFGGYRRYLFDWHEHRWRPLLPAPLWRGLGALWPQADWLPRPLRWRRTLQDLGSPPGLAYARSVSANLPAEVFALLRPEHRSAAGDPLQPLLAAYEQADGPDALSRAAATDFATWLPGDILVKVDRAAMAVGLEVRAPFLDHVLVEYAATIPATKKLAGGRTKAFLRDALLQRLDARALRRRKQGFSVPLRRWLRGEVGGLLERELDSQRLGEWIDPAAARALLQRHRVGVRDHAELLWATLVFARFLRRWCP